MPSKRTRKIPEVKNVKVEKTEQSLEEKKEEPLELKDEALELKEEVQVPTEEKK